MKITVSEGPASPTTPDSTYVKISPPELFAGLFYPSLPSESRSHRVLVGLMGLRYGT